VKNLMNIINLKAMKTQSAILIMLLMVFSATASPHADHNPANQVISGGSLSIEASADLQPLLKLWEGAFSEQNPGVNMHVGESQELFLNSNHSIDAKNQAWTITIGKKILIPLISDNNPNFELIQKRGITVQLMKELLSGREKPVQSLLIGEEDSKVFRLLVYRDESVVNQLEQTFGYIAGNQFIDQISTVEEMKSVMATDPGSIVLIPLSVLFAEENPILYNGYSILPIDRNENGTIEKMEDFYGNLDAFIRSVWIGKYPHSLTMPIAISSTSTDMTEAQAAFINWALTSGQRFLAETGCVDLSGIERETALAAINAPVAETEAAQPASAWFIILLVIVGGIGLLGFVVTWLFRSTGADGPVPTVPSRNGVFNADTIESPKGILYDKTHTWAFMENDGMVRVGMDGFIGHLAGNTSKVVSKSIGEKVAKGDRIITLVCNGKQMELRSPISGTIRTFNTSLENGINPDSITENWVYNIEPANWKRDSQFMIMYDQYRLWLKDEFARLRDFLATAVNAHAPQYAQIALQDGGELREGLFAELGPEVWEDFQYGFLDSLR
jgi:glycine cleavage system H lipoate-binding protein